MCIRDRDKTGTLFVFTKQSEEDYSGYFLETEEEIEEFLNTFGIGPTQTTCLIDTGKVCALLGRREELAIREFIESLNVDFPVSEEMSAASRYIENTVYDLSLIHI